MYSRFSFAFLLLFPFATACTNQAPATSGVLVNTDLGGACAAVERRDLATMPPEVLAKIRAHVDDEAASGRADAWKGADLVDDFRVIELTGVPGDGAYEARLQKGGVAAGYLVIHAKSLEVTHWNPDGRPPVDRLCEEAGKTPGAAVTAIYQSGADYIAEDADGHVVAATRPVTTERWQEVKAKGVEPEVEADAGALSLSVDTNPNDPGAVNQSCRVDTEDLVPNYRQLAPHEGANNQDRDSGCGPTAWAMVLAWADKKAELGYQNFPGYRNLYPWGMAPGTMDYQVGAWMMEIAADLGTFNAGGQGATPPFQMDGINKTIQRRGYTIKQVDGYTNTDGTGLVNQAGIQTSARRWICASPGQPALVGVGNLEHYAVATRYYKKGGTNGWWLKMGHGGGNDGWYTGRLFLAGGLNFQPGGMP